MKAFVSYSHNDELAVERLRVHLAQLKREGKVMEWHDRDIIAGGPIDDEISKRLETSDIFIPLVSPDFLNSDYCYKKEMTRAIEKHEAGEMRVIPIIVEPCDWKASPLGRFKALPKDGKPISEWANANNAFLDIVGELRRISVSTENSNRPKAVASHQTGSRYRVQRKFDAIDRADFRIRAFETIREYFRKAADEIDTVEGIRARFRNYSDISFGAVVLNSMNDRSEAHITVHVGGDHYSMGDITYSFQENAPANSSSGSFNVDTDGYDLFLRRHSFGGRSGDGRVTFKEAARVLWDEFVEHAGISHD